MERKVLNIVCLLGALLGIYLIASGVITNRETWRAYVNKATINRDENAPQKLYHSLIDKGYTEQELGGSEEEFVVFMSDKSNRHSMYYWISDQIDRPFNLGDYDAYENRLSVSYGQTDDYGPKEYALMNATGANDAIRNTYLSIGIGVVSILFSLITWIYGGRMG